MMIETERLEQIPLSPRQLRLWVEDMAALEKELSAVYRAEPLEGLFLEIVSTQMKITEKDPEYYQWHSFWFLIRKSDRMIVGATDFKDRPSDTGEVEIGYGLGKDFEHNGYMTEAVKALCDWAFGQSGVTSIIAETDLDGFASHGVLTRCGFVKDSQGETLWWKKIK